MEAGLLHPGLGRLDDCAVLVVADALKRHGIDARVAGATSAIEKDKASSIRLCYLEDVSKARPLRKLSRSAPTARMVVCLLADSPESSETPKDQAHPRSLKATIALFADPRAAPEASLGTNGHGESSG